MFKLMKTKARLITISEYQRIYSGDQIDGVTITKKDIAQLRDFIDNANSPSSRQDAVLSDFMKPIKNGVQVTNYVGVIQTESNLTIEILPKIYQKDGEKSKENLRRLFLKMLKTLNSSDGKIFKMASLNLSRHSLLDVFIAMFLQELEGLLRKGLKSDYVTIEENEPFLKGKLLQTEHLRRNKFVQTHFYNAYDEFLQNSPENQIIKTTLLLLLNRSRSQTNVKKIKEFLQHFDAIEQTYNPKVTFQKIKLSRYYKYYQQTLDWCSIFLNQQSFTSFKGKSLALAILFPMEKIFESYVANLSRIYLPQWEVKSQDSRYYLFDKSDQSNAAYKLRPDLVLKDSVNQLVIADTKWKLLDYTGPSQPDLYQMFAYQTRYQHRSHFVDRVILIFPYTKDYTERQLISLKQGFDEARVRIQVRFIDLFADDMETEIKRIYGLI